MTAAAVEAQRTMAQIQGAPATSAAPNFLLNGAAFCGVFGAPRIEERMNAGGGYRPRAEVVLRATRGQFSAPPKTQINLTRTDITPHQSYRVESVDSHDPLFYVFTLVKVGPT